LLFTHLRVTLNYVEAKMATQNITLALPKDLLLKAKFLAVRRGTSVSGLLAGELARLVAEDEAYDRARQSHLARMETVADLGTMGHIEVKRDELHER
jgi:hypothetical protein